MAEDVPDPEARPPLSQMGLVAVIAIPGAAEFAAAARQWFATLPGLLAPEEWDEVLREEKPLFRGKPQVEWPLFEDYQEPLHRLGGDHNRSAEVARDADMAPPGHQAQP
jgi:hypothetical protein